MHELRRMAYLEALGIDSYVSRRQLPGAAPTKRLAIVSPLPAEPVPTSEVRPGIQGASEILRRQEAGSHAGSGAAMPIESATPSSPTTQDVIQRGSSVPRFSLTAIVAGDWLWLEELDDMPLTMEQVRLVQAMAGALKLVQGDSQAQGEGVAPSPARPEVAQFDWPIHTNHQLDLGEEAAQAAVAGFVGRKLEQFGCRGLVLLGQGCAVRMPVGELNKHTVSTASSAEILARPTLKAQVWRDLRPLAGKG